MVPAAVENGSSEADMAAEEETWEQKEEPGGGGGGGGQESLGLGAVGEEPPEMMEEEEEEEEMPMPKVVLAPPDAPKKEHVNVVFIGHVGASRLFVHTVFHPNRCFTRCVYNHFCLPDAGKSTIGGQIMYVIFKVLFIFFNLT